MSDAQPKPTNSGLAQLKDMRAARRRRPAGVREVPPPRHKPAAREDPAETEDSAVASTNESLHVPALPPVEIVREITPEISHEVDQRAPQQPSEHVAAERQADQFEQVAESREATPPPVPAPVVAARGPQPEGPASPPSSLPAGSATMGRSATDESQTATPLPDLEIDLDDPTALIVTPTVCSVGSRIMRRFDVARASAASHTAVVIDAMRAHARELPELVLASKPGGRPDDLFPWRETAGQRSTDRPEPLRLRPIRGELAVIDKLVDWVNTELNRRRPGIKKVSRSEVVAVALVAYLPAAPKRNRRR